MELPRQVINAFPHNFEIALSMTNAGNTGSVSLEQQSNFSDFQLKIHSEVHRKHSLENKKQTSFLAGTHLRSNLHKTYSEIH